LRASACWSALVRGAVALSLRLGISAVPVSVTIAGFGTSAPELPTPFVLARHRVGRQAGAAFLALYGLYGYFALAG
jgi:Ca2+/Na+ antiporter